MLTVQLLLLTVAMRGKPDIIFSRARVAVFLDGCFWHRCHLCHPAISTMTPWWQEKLRGNEQRDAEVTSFLESHGWQVIRIWEHEISKPEDLARVSQKISRAVSARRASVSIARV